MKKNNNIDEIAAEYDFSKGVRGKHHKKMTEGYTITVYSPNKNAYEKRVAEKVSYIKIDKDVYEIFKTSEEINNALRAFINSIPKTSRKTAHAH